MITLFVSIEESDRVQQIIDQEYRLNELVSISSEFSEDAVLYVSNSIHIKPDWENLQPPVLFPEVPFSDAALTGLIYTKLGNYPKAAELLAPFPHILQTLELLNSIHYGIPLTAQPAEPGSPVALHNRALAIQYGISQVQDAENQVEACFLQAIAGNEDAEQQLFSRYHLAQFYIDQGREAGATQIMESSLLLSTRPKTTIAFKDLRAKSGIKKIRVPYNTALIEQVKSDLWECLEYYEARHRKSEAALALTDASYVATLSNSFSEALGYINRAITLFEAENMTELKAQADMQKGDLLQTWAQNGNPQFYRTAVQAYQNALQVFTKEDAPELFAGIQHQLGRVYAEIPDEVKKKGVWAAVSVSSFNEALQYFNKIDFPYEFAMICNSFGNAYTKYPVAVHTDNFDKALAWYREALDIRTAENYPLERVLTLANYLEASWFAGNKEEFDEERYLDMMSVAREILQLTNDEAILESTRSHIDRLIALKAGFTV